MSRGKLRVLGGLEFLRNSCEESEFSGRLWDEALGEGDERRLWRCSGGQGTGGCSGEERFVDAVSEAEQSSTTSWWIMSLVKAGLCPPNRSAAATCAGGSGRSIGRTQGGVRGGSLLGNNTHGGRGPPQTTKTYALWPRFRGRVRRNSRGGIRSISVLRPPRKRRNSRGGIPVLRGVLKIGSKSWRTKKRTSGRTRVTGAVVSSEGEGEDSSTNVSSINFCGTGT